jgi:hypothetical protein
LAAKNVGFPVACAALESGQTFNVTVGLLAGKPVASVVLDEYAVPAASGCPAEATRSSILRIHAVEQLPTKL